LENGYFAAIDLIVELAARTSEPGMYYLHGELYVPLGMLEENEETGTTGIGFHIIELAPATVHLNESVQTVAINFEGGSIHNNEINGPYEVKININNETWGFGHAFDHTTGDYEFAQFEQPSALLSGPVRSKALRSGALKGRRHQTGTGEGSRTWNCSRSGEPH
jgi:hypothetical protein